MTPVLDRMPFIVSPENYDAWLDPASAAFESVLQTNRNEALQFYRRGLKGHSTGPEGTVGDVEAAINLTP